MIAFIAGVGDEFMAALRCVVAPRSLASAAQDAAHMRDSDGAQRAKRGCHEWHRERTTHNRTSFLVLAPGMIYAKNVFRAIIAISGVATAAHATPAAPTNTWNEGQGHGANGRGPRGFTSRFIDTLGTDGGAGATADAVASPSNYGGKKKSQLNALRRVDSPRNTSKFATASPIGTPTNGKNGQASVKTYEQQQQSASPKQETAKPCPNSAKTAQSTSAPTSAYGNKDKGGNGKGKDKNKGGNDKNHKMPATPAPTPAYGNKDKGGNGKLKDNDKGGNDKKQYKTQVTSTPTTTSNDDSDEPCPSK
ncbi:hypothetical protein PybrP1_000554, partial [[Pythium] brassicae (nom. inval.)]